MPFHILSGILPADLANNGTVTTGYPAGKVQADFTGSDGHSLVLRQIEYTTALSQFSVAFDASTLTWTNLTGKTFPAGELWQLQINEYAETTGILLSRALGDADGDRLQDVTVGTGLLLSGRTLSCPGTFATGTVTKHITPPVTLTVLGAGATTFAVTSSFAIVDGDTGGNTIGTITGGVAGMELVLMFVDASVTITDTSAATADTVNLSAAFTSSANDILTLIYDGTKWFEKARSVN